ncbi:flagellar filament capping protein FliD [Candidatus Odyssella thessalonicensis]|uniref:flagellar filament capping protein FliD n=1 Tax=Candidatus Odyssella thessalonicensis TaxID=84647 RepID=UPI000225ABA1|nr:flagellar filament capping protein FliD [Candidatus Odyssella thessalonicensis]
MVTSVKSDFGMGLGKVIVDEESKTPRISQKVAGIDIDEYLSAYKDAKKTQEKPYQDKIDKNTKTLAALSTFQNKLKAVDDIARTMANRISSTYYGKTTNAFAQRTVSATASNGSDYTKIINITPLENADKGSFSARVDQLATYDSKKGVVSASNINAALGITGSFSINSMNGTAVDITIDSSMSLDAIRSAINSVSNTTNVTASVTQISYGMTPTFELRLNAQNMGEAILLKNNAGTTPLDQLGIPQLASPQICSVISTTNESTALGLTGNLVFGAGGAQQILALNPAWTLDNLKTQINAITGTTNVQADYERPYPSSNIYQLKLTSTDTPSTNILIDPSSDTTSLKKLGLDAPGVDFNTLCAKVNINGNDFKRSTNSIYDIVPNVRLDLVSVPPTTVPATTVTAVISDDKNAFAAQFLSFIDAYNDLITFYNDQTKPKMKSDGTIAGEGADGADLYGNSFARSAINQIKSSLFGSVAGAAANTGASINGSARVSTLLSMGVGVNKEDSNTSNGTLTTDMAAFAAALDNNFSDVKQLFSNMVSISNSSFSVSDIPTTLPNDIAENGFKVEIVSDALGVKTAKFTLGSTDYAADVIIDNVGINIRGKAGTSFAGINILYGQSMPNSSSATANINITQGRMAALDSQILRVIDTTLDPATGKKKGTIFVEIDNLNTSTTSQQKVIDRIEGDIKKESARIEKEFMKVYEATFELENIMNMIDSFNKAN